MQRKFWHVRVNYSQAEHSSVRYFPLDAISRSSGHSLANEPLNLNHLNH